MTFLQVFRSRRSPVRVSALAVMSRRGRPTARSLLVLCLALVGAGVPAGAQGGADAPVAQRVLRLSQLDVGQGDAALITTPEGRRILIDAGPRADDVAALLRAEGIDTLHLVVASHNHADHIGGMPRVLESVVVLAYVENGLPHPTAIYRRTLAALEREPGLLYLEATDRTVTVGSVTVRVMAAPRVSTSQNNNSVGVVVEHGIFKALYTGDSEATQLAAWLRQGRVPGATVVKVAHHGSPNGTLPEWVQATSPAVALVSAGRNNSYGHPAPQVEALWSAVGAHVYRTDRHGTIEIDATPDGRFTVRTGTPHARIP